MKRRVGAKNRRERRGGEGVGLALQNSHKKIERRQRRTRGLNGAEEPETAGKKTADKLQPANKK